MLFRVIVETPRQSPQGSLLGQAVEGKVDPLTIPEIEEITGNKNGTTTSTANAVKYL